MTEQQSNQGRARDDQHLRALVDETRQWMQAEGIVEQALDWDAIVREEEALWWRERLRQALGELATRGQGVAASIAARLRALAAAAESQADAALEVTLDAVQQMGHVLAAPAQSCLRPGATLQFQYAASRLRIRGQGPGAGQDESVGVFSATATIPGARVVADAPRHRVTVEFEGPLASLLVALIPDDPTLVPRLAEVTVMDATVQARFDEVAPGRYLLAVYTQEEHA